MEVDVNSEETYSSSDAIAYIRDTMREEIKKVEVWSDGIFVKYVGNNRPEVFAHLAERGWIVTSVYHSDVGAGSTHVYLNQVE